MKGLQAIIRIYQKYGVFIVAVWLAFSLFVGIPGLLDFIGRTRLTYDSPSYTESAKGEALMNEHFPGISNRSNLILIIKTDETHDIYDPEVIRYHNEVIAKYNTTLAEFQPQFISYWLLNLSGLDNVKATLVSEDNKTTIVIISMNVFDIDKAKGKIPELRRVKGENQPDWIKAYLTGTIAMAYDSNQAIEKDLIVHDAVALPLILILLMILLGSWRLLLVALLSLGVGVLSAFAVMDVITIAFDLEIMSFVPSVMFAIMLGAGVDYNLFLLSRFREEREKGKDKSKAAEVMLHRAGHNVLTSGLTLAVSFLALVAFPILLFRSMGYAIFITIIIGLFVSFTFVPSLLLGFGEWFYQPKMGKSTDKISHSAFWKKWAKVGVRRPKTIIVLTILLTLPVAGFVLDVTPTASTPSFAPLGTESNYGFKVLSEDFSPGVLAPVYVVVDTHQIGGAWNETIFNNIQQFVLRLLKEVNTVDAISVASHTYLGGQAILYPIAIRFAFQNQSDGFINYNSSQAIAYRQQVFPLISEDMSKVVIRFSLTVDPLSYDGGIATRNIRDLAREIESTYGYDVFVTGLGPVNEDIIQSSYEIFPYMMIAVIVVIYLIVGLLFKSALLPLRLIITIGLTIFFVYGLAFFAFQEGILANLFSRYADTTIIFWVLPIMSASMLIGLGMDYDIFLVERVREEASYGLSDREAVIEAAAKTGQIITGAGTVMAIAFGGLLLGSSVTIIEFGFVLTIAVLIDTYFVRTILVPSIMVLAEKYNWWPSDPRKGI